MIKKIITNRAVREGIKPLKKGTENVKLFCFDTETCDGEPYILQIYDGAKAYIETCTKENILGKFTSYFNKHADKNILNIVAAHNLQYDMVSLLYDRLEICDKTEIEFEFDKWTFKIFMGATTFARVTSDDGIRILMIDTFAFYRTSLEKICKSLNIKFQKQEKPKKLGKIKYKLTNKKFYNYCLHDVLTLFDLLKHIIELHEKYTVTISVSMANLAQKIFRKIFLQDGKIPYPPETVAAVAMLSYHGGKNGLYVPMGKYENVYEYDINSAYPTAMKDLPDMIHGKYIETNYYDPNLVGIYRVTGWVKKCKYKIIPDHDFQYITGDVYNICVTSYELKEALRMKEIKIDVITGYLWEPSPDAHKYKKPLAEYVDYFYSKKESTPKTDPMYKIYKLLLNALYGKFIQSMENSAWITAKYNLDTEKMEQKTFNAGGMFHPFIASLITGYCRAYLHRLEHKYKSIHSATDSVKTLIKPKDIPGLGGCETEIFGDCIIFRNKLYLHYKGKYNKIKTPEKSGLHAFRGTWQQLRDMYITGNYKYTYTKVNKVKESLKQNLKANKFEEKIATLKLKKC